MLIITYFDDELLFKIAISKFIEKIESHIWTREQINEYCDLNEEIIVIDLSKGLKNNFPRRKLLDEKFDLPPKSPSKKF